MKEILVLDLEATCWPGRPPEGQLSDIIEIGMAIVRFDFDTENFYYARLDPESIFVKPGRSGISEFCTELTGITEEMVAGGLPFVDAMEALRKWKDTPWASWGDYDRNKIERDCSDLGIKYPLAYTHINVKTMWAVLNGYEPTSLAEAVKIEGYKFIGENHRGSDDALNIALLLRDMVQRHKKES